MSEITVRLVEALADRYRIERELGAGGMARESRMNSLLGITSPSATSAATDPSSGRIVGVSTVLAALASRSDALPSSEFIRGKP